MPILTDEKQMRGALQMAARSPFEGADPGFIERFKADYTAMVDGKNVDARTTTRSDIQDEYIRDFYKASGQRLPRWLGGPGVNSIADREQSVRGQVDAWNAANPNAKFRPLPTDQEIEEETIRRATGAIKTQTQLERRSTGAGSSIGGFLGTAAGAMADPINFMSVGLGGGAGGYLRTALTEGAIGMASESAVQGFNYDFRKKVDPNYSAGDALTEIAAAGVGAAALSTGLKGLADVWQRAKTGSWPSHVRDAANVVTREAAVPSGRFEKSVDGATAHQAALQKSLDDLIQSRPVELPPEAFMQANARPGRVYDADGNSIGVRYEVVDADTLITSNRDDLSINPDFPQELQPRDRSRAMSQDQIAGIAANLQPERLGFSSDASTGAPIIGADGLVESGNGRVLAIRRAYQQGGIPADNYRNYLRSQNFDVDGIRNPVLVARRVTDLEDRVAFVTAANRSTAMRLGAAEQALSDARLLDGDLMSRLDGADIKGSGNQAFTRGFMQKLPRAEQGNLIDKDGFLSQEGERRITSALMGRAYGEPTMLTRALEDTDNNIKSIAGALADSAGPWAVMRDAVSRGDIPAGMDITDDLVNAVRLVMKARDEGRAVRDVVNQGEMFGGPDELSKIVARAMFSDVDLKKPVGRARLSEFLRDYATEAMKNDAGPRLFGDALGSADILKSSLERVGRSDLHRVAEERLTPENIQKLYESPETAEVSVMDAERLIMDNEERQLGPVLSEGYKLPDSLEMVNKDELHRRLKFKEMVENKGADPIDGSLGQQGIVFWEDEAAINIAGSYLPSSERGRGKGFQMYKALADYAVAKGKILKSDFDVSPEALRVYDKLAKSGYNVERSVSFRSGEDSGYSGKFIGGSDAEGNRTDGFTVRVVPAKREVKPIMVDLGDGRGERDLADILREADDEIAAAQELEACTIGKVAGE